MYIQFFGKRLSATASLSDRAASKAAWEYVVQGSNTMGKFLDGDAAKRQSAIAEIESATKSFLESRWHGVDDQESSLPTACERESPVPPTGWECEYPVADVVGRCFLRVCFWADVFASWARRGRPFQVRVSSGRAPAEPLLPDTSAIPAKPSPSVSPLNG